MWSNSFLPKVFSNRSLSVTRITFTITFWCSSFSIRTNLTVSDTDRHTHFLIAFCVLRYWQHDANRSKVILFLFLFFCLFGSHPTRRHYSLSICHSLHSPRIIWVGPLFFVEYRDFTTTSLLPSAIDRSTCHTFMTSYVRTLEHLFSFAQQSHYHRLARIKRRFSVKSNIRNIRSFQHTRSVFRVAHLEFKL